jgi:NAD(P) transhydrogenase
VARGERKRVVQSGPVSPHERYDLLVIGSGPAGQKAAIAAAKLRKRVAMVDRKEMMGGCCVHTGTIPSKTLREAILYLSGFRQRTFYGQAYAVKDEITAQDLSFRVRQVMAREIDVVSAQLKRNHVAVFSGRAEFIDAHSVVVVGTDDSMLLTADYVLIACGTRPARDAAIPFDGQRILDADQLLDLRETSGRSVIVVGAGVIGLEYASMIAALNVEVTVVEQRAALLEFIDREIVDALSYHLRRRNVAFRLGEKVTAIELDDRERVVAKVESGKRIHGDSLLYTVGRQGNGDQLQLEAAGLETDARGRIAVNAHFQTAVPHIYAAGDVIGFPALASTSMEQGRLASCHMFAVPTTTVPELYPYGIYTIPEISMVGRTEEQLTAAKVPYEFGVSKFEELAKGQMLGDDIGMLKLLFSPDTRKLYGVHIIGESAAELIHIGQAVLATGGTIEYFRDTVFNYPTLAEAYKVAALDGLNKL